MIPSKKQLTPRIASDLLVVTSSSNKMKIEDFRKLLDELCTAKKSLISNVNVWNAYLIGCSTKWWCVEELQNIQNETLSDHALELVEKNMPHYGVEPNPKTIVIVVGILMREAKFGEVIRRFNPNLLALHLHFFRFFEPP